MFKKVFAAMLVGLFVSAPAFAEVKMSGSFFLKGNYVEDGQDFYGNGATNADGYRYYESDFEVKTKFVVDENTSADLVVEAFDTNWVKAANAGSDLNGQSQNHLQVTKAKMNHKFTETNTAFTGGIEQNGNSWGTLFGDTLDYAYFLQAEQALPFGTLTVKTEKIDEGVVSDDDKDVDAYLVGLSLKVAGFDVMPAVYMVNDQDKTVQNDELTKFIVSASGKVANININTEFDIVDYDAADAQVFGLWIDAATTVAGLGVNAAFGYGSTDDATGFDYGDELCPMEVLGDEIALVGVSFLKVGVSKSITEKVSADAALAYAMTNLDDNDKGANAFDSVYEFDANVSYKATDAVTLSAGASYLDGDYANENAWDDAMIVGYAKMNVAF